MPKRRCCQQAELAAFIDFAGEASHEGVVITTGTAAVARKVFLLTKQVHGRAPQTHRPPGRRSRYLVQLMPGSPADASTREAAGPSVPGSAGKAGAGAVGQPVGRAAAESGNAPIGRAAAEAGNAPIGRAAAEFEHAPIRGSAGDRAGASVPERDCCARAYLRGAWLSRGSMTEPDAGYHLEFVAAGRSLSKALHELLGRYGVTAGLTRRKTDHVVYIKGADGIAEVLRLTGAHGALLELEDFRVLKEMRNRINRLVNAESSNVEKAVTAALKQVEDIRLIDERMGLDRLPASLRELAYVRLTYPDASLRDLGHRFDPPLSKSAVNHRMRRLSRIAEDLRRNHPAPG